MVWALRNHIDKGVKYAWKHYLLVMSLRKQLLEAGLYITTRIGASEVARLPQIGVEFLSGFASGVVFIEDSIKLHDKLSKVNISAALGNYVIEQRYLTNDGNFHRFDFYDASIERRLTFETFKAFKKYSASTGKYDLFVDAYTRLPLAHHLTFIRDNLPWKTVLGNAEDQTYVTAYGASVDIPERKMEIGEGVYTYPAIANKPKLCAFPTLDFDILESLR